MRPFVAGSAVHAMLGCSASLRLSTKSKDGDVFEHGIIVQSGDREIHD